MMAVRIEVDHDACVGYTECARVAPTAFTLNEENQSVASFGAEALPRETLEAAAAACPMQAIEISDDGDALSGGRG